MYAIQLSVTNNHARLCYFQVYEKYPAFDLTSRKDYIKMTVKQASSMMTPLLLHCSNRWSANM